MNPYTTTNSKNEPLRPTVDSVRSLGAAFCVAWKGARVIGVGNDGVVEVEPDEFATSTEVVDVFGHPVTCGRAVCCADRFEDSSVWTPFGAASDVSG
jgi:hypothetical protein